jgi:hypothetical protein
VGRLCGLDQSTHQANRSLAGFLNPTLYDIGLTRGSANDLYTVCFNDVADGIGNFNGFGLGYNSVPGYDLCTGLGTPKVRLIYQISSPPRLRRTSHWP